MSRPAASPLRRRGPKGAAASIIVLYSTITLMMLTVLAYVTGRLSAAKEEVSARSDAVVLTMSEAIKRHGPHEYCNDPAVQALLRDYGGNCPVPVKIGANAYRIDYAAREMNIEIPTGFFDRQNIEVTTRVAGEVRHEYVEVEERRPKFVLVLDYSGSMGAQFGGGGNRTAALKQSVNTLLNRHYKVDYGAVIFDNDIVATVPIARNNEGAVAAQVNRFGPMGGTCYHGLATALGMLRQQPNQGYYVLFVTDGEPNNGCSDGAGEAVQLWNNDATIFTLFIGNNGNAQNRLVGLSGSPQSRHDAHFAFQAGDPAALRRTFDRIIGFIVCRADAPSPEVAPDREHIFVSVENTATGRESGVERVPLAAFQNAPDQFDNRPVFSYIPDAGEHGQLVLNQMACQPVLDGDARIVLRYQRPGLAAAQ